MSEVVTCADLGRIMLSVRDLRRRFAVSNITIHRMVRDGRLPKPFFFGTERRWWKDEIDAAEQGMRTSIRPQTPRFGARQGVAE